MKEQITILLWILSMNNVKPENYKFTPITSGLLPYKVGVAKLVETQHTFLHDIDLEPLSNHTIDLKNQLNYIEKKMTVNTKSTTYKPIVELLDFARFTINSTIENIENLKPLDREKRGLINIVGKASKWLFGTLDNEDGEYYDKTISKLKTNMNIIKTNYNHQLSLNKELVQKFDKVFSQLSTNQKRIETKINELIALDNQMDDVAKYLRIQALINQLILHSQYLNRIIDNIENSIMFAKLNTLHNTVINNKDLLIIIKSLKSYYNENELITLKDSRNYYKLASPEVFFYNSKIIFAIHFPIANTFKYNFYHLYPVPHNNLCIFPPYPYLALANMEKFYQSHECPQLENTFICTNPILMKEDNCILPLISKGSGENCTFSKTVTKRTLIQQISPMEIILIPDHNDVIQVQCDDKTSYIKITTSKLLTLNSNCIIQINNKHIYTKSTKIKGNPFILPTIDEAQIIKSQTHLKLKPIELDNINLETIYEISKDIEKSKFDIYEEFDTSNSMNITWIIIGSIALFFVLLGTILCWQRKKNSKTIREEKVLKIAVENQPPSSNFRGEELRVSNSII